MEYIEFVKMVRKMIKEKDGNINQAALMLGMTASSIHYIIKNPRKIENPGYSTFLKWKESKSAK